MVGDPRLWPQIAAAGGFRARQRIPQRALARPEGRAYNKSHRLL